MGKKAEILIGHQEVAFQTFVYEGRPIRDFSGMELSEKQYEAYELYKRGMTSKEIGAKMEVSVSSVLSMFTSIRKKGWAI